MKSMTGYGKAEVSVDGITVTVEIKTVNNRFLDINLKYPRCFLALDDVMRKAIQSKIKRGKADVFVSYKNDNADDVNLEVDLALAGAYLAAARKIKDAFLDVEDDYTLTSVMKAPDVIKQSQDDVEVEKLSVLVKNCVEKACDALNEMREFEGEKLAADLLGRMSVIENTVEVIAKRAPLVSESYKERLSERINDAMQGVTVDEARLLQEVAIFADKCNIDEELTRLRSHVEQFKSICASNGEIGKRLDFLVQEFNREANTVCSKSNDVTVTDNALTLKCEIEKVREQIQNVE